MRPVFRDLANPELLKKCLHGGTQNPNESVNNVIWSRVPKKTFVQLEVLSLGTYDAVSSFNMGNVSKLEILRKVCIEPGDYTRFPTALKRKRKLNASGASKINLYPESKKKGEEKCDMTLEEGEAERENETEVTTRGREWKSAGRGRKAQNAFEKHQNAVRRKNAAIFFPQLE
ncbi:uncharacterized protein TNCV_237471 [Trichonephila clavipes]|nr:uncharacterized protein TNCV_237471 [Trichonephila clavipes]